MDDTAAAAVIVVARHGERLDYVTRDSGGNWVATAHDRPFDTPLTIHGEEQGFRLGRHLVQELERKSLPPISEIYASPFFRCRQTACAALRGIRSGDANRTTNNEEDTMKKNHSTAFIPGVRVEEGLAESINESWYRSWALPGADGTWNYRPPGQQSRNIDPATLHPLAKVPIQNILLDWRRRVVVGDNSNDDDAGLNAVVNNESIEADLDLEYESVTKLETPYTFHPPVLESREDQRQRMLDTVRRLCQSGKTILLVSHGGPVTHLYEELTGNSWHVHGESSYCCYSIYRSTDRTNTKWEPLAVNVNGFLQEKPVTERHVSDLN